MDKLLCGGQMYEKRVFSILFDILYYEIIHQFHQEKSCVYR